MGLGGVGVRAQAGGGSAAFTGLDDLLAEAEAGVVRHGGGAKVQPCALSAHHSSARGWAGGGGGGGGGKRLRGDCHRSPGSRYSREACLPAASYQPELTVLLCWSGGARQLSAARAGGEIQSDAGVIANPNPIAIPIKT